MFARIRTSHAASMAFAVLAALALALRIAIPAGYMPSSTSMVVEICSDASGKTAAIDLSGRLPEKDEHKADKPCTFAVGLGHALLNAQAIAAIVPFIYGQTITVGTAIADLTVHRLAAPPPPSQGPPSQD